MPDFQNGKIYKITNDYNDDVYVGSTCDILTKRFSYHKADSLRVQKKNSLLYKLINEIGFERFRIQLIEDYPCEDMYQLRQREGYWIRTIGTLNKRIAGRTDYDYYQDNKERFIKYSNEYREQNKEKCKDYREQNKEKSKEYREQNKDKMKEYKKQTILCDCGLCIQKYTLSRHKMSKKHLDLMQAKQE